MDWLSSADFARQQTDFIGRRQEETGLWFLNSHEFTEWVHGPSQTLFCPGIPGAGKTMMAAIAVDHLQKAIQTPAVGVAYLYCNYKRQAEQTISGLLTAMLKQLVQDQPSFSKPLQSMYDLHETKKTRPSFREISAALQSVLAKYSRVYVVIDALDECSDQDGTRSQLLDFCRSLQGQMDLRLMATSRHIPDIVDKFRNIPQLEVRASDTDVKRYVIGQTSRLANCIQRDNDLQELMQGKIVDAVDGM
jgi:Cdc6-like AAA superfamily ATPase